VSTLRLVPLGTSESSPGRSPGFGMHHRVAPKGRLKTRLRCSAVPRETVQRSVAGNPGTLRLTIHLGNDTWRSQTKLSSRPERSVVEGSAVRLSAFPNSSA